MKIEYTKQGYSYVRCTKDDCFKWGGMAICDSCNEFMQENVYLIYILNQAFCEKCFKDWQKRSKKYDSDLQLQKQNHIAWYKAHKLEFEE